MSNIVEFIYKLTDQVSKPLEKIVRNTQSMQVQAEKTQSVMGRMGSSVLRWGAAFVGVQQTVKQGSMFVRLGLDMEQTRVKFETLTQSMTKGNALIEKISASSQVPLFGRAKLLDSAETLLAFNVSAEKTAEFIPILGDIAMGNRNKLAGLSLAFAQMSSTGKLTGQDLLQMINQGFNPLAEIARTTGKSVAILKEEMGKGAISAKMVEDAFRSATEEGGSFFRMSEKIAETGLGKVDKAINIIKDKLTVMSEKLQPMYDKATDAFLHFANNFEKFATAAWRVIAPIRIGASILSSAINIYSKYKGILIGVTAASGLYALAVWNATLATKGWTIASMLQYKWLLLVEGAQKLLNATLLKNPFTAAMVGITLLIGTLITLRKRTREATDDLSALNKTAASYAAEEKARLDILFDQLKKTNPKSKERNDLLKQLKDQYPDVIKGINLEKASLEELNAAYNDIINSIDRKARMRAAEDRLVELYDAKIEAEIEKTGAESAYNSAKQDYDWQSKNASTGEHGATAMFSASTNLLRAKNKLDKITSNIDKIDKNITNTRQYAVADTSVAGSGVKTTTTSLSTESTDISSLTKSGAKATNITINLRNLIEYLNMYPQTVQQGVNETSDQLIEGLLRVLNSANRIATQ